MHKTIIIIIIIEANKRDKNLRICISTKTYTFQAEKTNKRINHSAMARNINNERNETIHKNSVRSSIRRA